LYHKQIITLANYRLYLNRFGHPKQLKV